MRTRVLAPALALALSACATGGPPDEEVAGLPLGSFCFGDDAASRTCLDAEEISASVTRTGDADHLRVRATLRFEWEDEAYGFIEEEAELELEGQVAAGAALPATAERVQLSVPALGACRYSRPISPFGNECGRFDATAICTASAYDDPLAVTLDLVLLDDDEVGGRFTATLPFVMPQGTCDNDSLCADAEPPEFRPDAPLPESGLFHLALGGS